MFYTSVERDGGKILVRGYDDNGETFFKKVNYKPTLYIPTNEKTKFKSLDNRFLEPMVFENMWEATKFRKKYQDVQNFDIFGMFNFVASYLNETYNEEIKYDESKINVAYIDIEVDIEGGYPNLEIANKEINAITIRIKGKYFVFGFKDYEPSRDDVIYIKCFDERELLIKFLDLIGKTKIDVFTGWNIESFDIPYIIRRLEKIFSEKTASLISPWNKYSTRTIFDIHGRREVYEIHGIQIIDYMQAYIKFAYTPQESYALDWVCYNELGTKKLDYTEYQNLGKLYKENFKTFIDYNIRDVELVFKLNEKRHLLSLIFNLAYYAKVNFQDVFKQTSMWDSMIYSFLLKKNIIIPQHDSRKDSKNIEGGFVRKALEGLNKWVAAFDLTSLYPSLMRQYNISPDTFRGMLNLNLDDIIDEKDLDVIRQAKKEQKTICGNGATFDKGFVGFMPIMIEKLFEERIMYKNKMQDIIRILETDKNLSKDKRQSLEYEKQRYKILQVVKKVVLNSAYGTIACNGFRFFDYRVAEAITLSGQMTLRWIMKHVNIFLNAYFKNNNPKEYIIYGDTDSIYVDLSDLEKNNSNITATEVDKFCTNILQKAISKAFEKLQNYLGCPVNLMHMKRETISKKSFFQGKKHYVLDVVIGEENIEYDEPKIKIVGFEAIRTTTPELVRDALKKCYEIILRKDEKTLKNFIQKYEDFYNSIQRVEEIASPKRAKDFMNYYENGTYTKGTPFHHRAAILFNKLVESNEEWKLKYDKIKEGEKIKYLYLKLPNDINENVIGFPAFLPEEFNLHNYIDRKTQFEKTFISPLKNITDSIKWNISLQPDLSEII